MKAQVLITSLLLAAGLISAQDSIEACLGKAVGAACRFRLPTVDDSFIAPDSSSGAEESGTCQIKSGVQMYCRTIPSQDSRDVCSGKAKESACTFQAVGRDTWVAVEAFTSQQERSDTRGAVYASFHIYGSWTEPEFFFKGMTVGQAKKKIFRVAGWPTKLALTLHSNDAWSFWKLTMNDTAVVEDPAGSMGSQEYASYHPPEVLLDSTQFAATEYWLEGPPASEFFDISSYGTSDDKCGGASGCQISLKAHTSKAKRAETTSCVSVRFLVEGAWTIPEEGEQFFCAASLGEIKAKTFTLASWPTRLWMAVNRTDSWGFWKLTVNDLDVMVDPVGQEGHEKTEYLGSRISDTSFWLEAPPRTQSFTVQTSASTAPNLDIGNAKSFQIHGACTTAWTNDMFCDNGAYVDKLADATVTVEGSADRSRYFYGEEDAPVNDPACCAQFTEWPNVDKWVTCGRCAALVETRPYGARCDKYCQSFGHECEAAAEEAGEQCAVLTVENCNKPILGWGKTSDMLCACKYVSAPDACAKLPGIAESMSFVYVEFVVRGLDYKKLRADSSLKSSFNDALKGAMALIVGGGLSPHHVTSLWYGSATVFAIVNVPDSLLVDTVMTLLRGAGPALGEAVTKVNGISVASSGPLSVATAKMESFSGDDLVRMQKYNEKKTEMEAKAAASKDVPSAPGADGASRPGATEAQGATGDVIIDDADDEMVQRYMPLQPKRSPDYIDDEKTTQESPGAFQVEGSHATLIIVIVCAGVLLLCAAVVCLLFRVNQLQRKLGEQPQNQAVAYNSTVAVGRPVTTDDEAGQSNPVVDGTLVMTEADEKTKSVS